MGLAIDFFLFPLAIQKMGWWSWTSRVHEQWTGRGQAQPEADPPSPSKHEINSTLFIDRGVPYMTDFPAAQRTRAESHHIKHAIQGYMEMWSRAGK